jgi:hypothetical protein
MWRSAMIVAGCFGAVLLWTVCFGAAEARAQQAPTFAAVDVWVDSGDRAMAAWQVVVQYDADDAEIVGVEGGEPGVFRSAPYFDENGKTAGRMILGAFTLDEANAPSGRVRVARLHLMLTGDTPNLRVALQAAAGSDGGLIDGTAGYSHWGN